MSKGKVNEKILKLIKEISKDDKKVADFLTDLFFEENEHKGQWQWKEVYTRKIEQCAEVRGNTNED